jgi:hypothetical protein
MTTGGRAAERLLAHLQLGRESPSRDYLDRIIREHQTRVPFETLTKLADYEPGLARGDFLPPLDLYVERIVTRGAGGLCWTLARGLKALLDELGFDAAFMIMEPGHCCVRVELEEGPFYADVGYAAPIFQAYPLYRSFSIDTHRERMEYEVRGKQVLVTRNPGPTKTLDTTPRTLESLSGSIAAANDWSAPMSFLHRLSYGTYVGGVYTSLRSGTLSRYLPGGPERTEIPEERAPSVFAETFGADPALLTEAAEVLRRHAHSIPAA